MLAEPTTTFSPIQHYIARLETEQQVDDSEALRALCQIEVQVGRPDILTQMTTAKEEFTVRASAPLDSESESEATVRTPLPKIRSPVKALFRIDERKPEEREKDATIKQRKPSRPPLRRTNSRSSIMTRRGRDRAYTFIDISGGAPPTLLGSRTV
ncbi:hypothetical protein V5O48_005665 [Marasmius crinis-equi]|uniref:Uncharacterized protein n=1 Tax=Marasmius crinis-equi TaxID=585013 RepID=A0ABR3FLQ1_9AGAR